MQEQIIVEQEDSECVFKLIVDGKIMCSARTLSYNLLLKIGTATGEEGKGYGKKLLKHIEKVAKEHNVSTMQTDDIDPCDHKAVCFFKSMGYKLRPIENDTRGLARARQTTSLLCSKNR